MLALLFKHTTVVLVVSICLMAQKFLLAILPVDNVTEKLLVEINPVYITLPPTWCYFCVQLYITSSNRLLPHWSIQKMDISLLQAGVSENYFFFFHRSLFFCCHSNPTHLALRSHKHSLLHHGRLGCFLAEHVAV